MNVIFERFVENVVAKGVGAYWRNPRYAQNEYLERFVHQGIKTLYVLDGTLNVPLPAEESWIEANAADGVYLPAGTPHRLLNFTTDPVSLLFQILPTDGPSWAAAAPSATFAPSLGGLRTVRLKA